MGWNTLNPPYMMINVVESIETIQVENFPAGPSRSQGVSILALIWNNINYLKIILDKYLQMKYV
jgi:hypothetical protein